MDSKLFKKIEISLLPFGFILTGLLIGLSIVPSLILLYKIYVSTDALNIYVRILIFALSLGVMYFLFGYSLLLFIVFFRCTFNIKSPKTSCFKWSKDVFVFAAYHGMLATAQFFILPFFRGTVVIIWFYRGMGASIGKNTFINTIKISDCNLISIGDNCIIGGDVIINGHSAEKDFLLKGNVTIGNNVTIGASTTILCGAVIEDNVIVGANSLILKDQTLKANSIYGGVPVKFLRAMSESKLHSDLDT